MFRSSVITPTVLTLKTQIGGDILTCPNPYPVLVIANDGTGLGTANSKEEYCVLWNDYVRNNALGDIYPTADGCEFNFYGNVAPDYLKIHYAYSIQSYSFGQSIIDFVPDGSDGWDVTALLEPTSFANIPDGLTVDSTHFDIDFWSSGLQTTIFDNTIATDQTENTGANGAGVYYVAVTYNFSDGTSFVVYGYYLVDATNTILKSVVVNGITVNSINGLVMDVTLNVVQTNCNFDFIVIGINSDNTNFYIGNRTYGEITVQPLTQYLLFVPNFDSSFASDYDGDPTLTQTIIIS